MTDPREERIEEVHARPDTAWAGDVYDATGRPIGGTRQREAPRARTWVQTGTSTGLSMGSALAIAISWSQHQSILWAIIHGFFGWFYVLWYAITR